MLMTEPSTDRLTIGWCEWLALPEFGLGCVKAKIDTAHDTSKLYAVEVRGIMVEASPWVRFKVFPIQRDFQVSLEAEAPLVGERIFRSPAGGKERRPVIRTLLTLGKTTWMGELALVGHDTEGFHLLVGRQAIRQRFVVDPARSFLAGPPAVN